MARIGQCLARSRTYAFAVLVAACAFAGCHRGTIQTAFYTDAHDHYPRADYADKIYYLFEGCEYLYVDWQDVRMMRLSVVRVDKNYEVKGFVVDPLSLRGSDRFHVRVEGLIGSTPPAEITLMESQWGMAKLPGIGTVHLLMDETQYGRARLDRMAIDFDPAFLKKVRGMVLAPAESVGGMWRFRKRTVISDSVDEQPSGKKVDYHYTTTKLLANPSPGNVPKLQVQVARKEMLRKSRNFSYYEEWEYWPARPSSRGRRSLRVKPLKTERVGEMKTDTDFKDHPGPEEAAATETIRLVFDVRNPPAGWTKPAYLADRQVVTDEKGCAVVNLWNLVPAATLPFNSLDVTIKAADDTDTSSRPQQVEILRTELVGWYRYWQQRPR